MSQPIHVSSRMGRYEVEVRAGGLSRLGEGLRQLGRTGKTAVITDDNVFAHWGAQALNVLSGAGIEAQAIRIPPGEGSKTLGTAERLYGQLIQGGFTRHDTVVALGNEAFGKPRDEADATRMLRALAGREHRVITGLCVSHRARGITRSEVATTNVRFRPATDAEIARYVETGEPFGKAGAYAIQGIAGTFVKKLVGSYTNVVGLPLTEVVGMLQGEGYPVYFNWLNSAEVDDE